MTPGTEPPQKTNELTNMLDGFFDGWRNYLVVVTLLSLVLAGSLLLAPPPLIPVNSTPETWNKTVEITYNIPQYYKWIEENPVDFNITEQTLYDGDTVVTYRDQTVSYSDFVLLKDNAKLVLHNCTLLLPDFSSYHPDNLFSDSVGLLLQDNASLEVYDSNIVPYDYVGEIGLMGNSSCILDNVVIANYTLNLDEQAQLIAKNAKLYYLSIDKDVKINVSGSHVRHLYQDHSWRDQWSNIVKVNSPTAVFADSTIDILSFRVTNSSQCYLTDMTGEHSHWNTYTDMAITGNAMNLTLTNSAVSTFVWLNTAYSDITINNAESTWIYAAYSHIHCNNSEIQKMILSGDTDTSIRNSNIEQLSIQSISIYPDEIFRSMTPGSMYQTLYLSESRIENLGIGLKTDVTCDDTYIQELTIGSAEATIQGTESYGSVKLPSLSHTRWLLTQEYRVQTIGDKRIVPGVELALVNSNGETVWSGVSNENGVATFNITYCSNYPLPEYSGYTTNYMKTWNLTGVHEDETITKQVTLTDTNPEITLDYTKDVFTLPIDNKILLYTTAALITAITLLKIQHILQKEPDKEGIP